MAQRQIIERKERKHILKGNDCDISRKSCIHRSGEHDAFQRTNKKKSMPRHTAVQLQMPKPKDFKIERITNHK